MQNPNTHVMIKTTEILETLCRLINVVLYPLNTLLIMNCMVLRVRVWSYWTKLVENIKFIEMWRRNNNVGSIFWWHGNNIGNYEVSNGKKTKWSLKPMAQGHVAHQVSWWHVKAYNDLVDHKIAPWSTRWHEWSPDATVEHQVTGRSTRWISWETGGSVNHRMAWWNNCETDAQ